MKRFLKKNGKTLLKYTFILALAIAAFLLAHKAGTAERGYEAIGGEIFVPFLVVFAEDIWKAIVPCKAVRSEDVG